MMVENKVKVDCEYDSLSPKQQELGLGVRHAQAFLMFTCLTIGYGMRVIMSVAIVAMTDKNTQNESEILVFDWNKQIQDVILSSFFWGYMCMQIPGGYISHKYGAKYLLGFAMLANGLVSIILPLSAQLSGWKAVCLCRAVQGLAQGSMLPCLHTLQGKWAPVNERGRISTYVYGGSQFGTVLAYPFSGFLAASSYGWPSIFYSAGVISLACGVIWMWLGAESPGLHGSISKQERDYIQNSLGQQDNKKPMTVPWIQILTHMPMWAMAVGHMGSSWLQLTLFTEIPSYLSKVMGVNMKSNGMLSALPFLGMWICSFLFSFSSDHLINKKFVSITTARKTANTIGIWGASLGLIILSFVPADRMPLAVVILIVTVSIKAAIFVGFHVNHIDISPNFAGTMMGICNCMSNLSGMMAPMTAGLVLQNEYDQFQWRKVFYICAGIGFVTNLFYILFGSAEKAPWNEPEFFEKTNEEKASTQNDEGND